MSLNSVRNIFKSFRRQILHTRVKVHSDFTFRFHTSDAQRETFTSVKDVECLQIYPHTLSLPPQDAEAPPVIHRMPDTNYLPTAETNK